MRKIICILFMSALFFADIIGAQVSPVWTQTINSLPDSAIMSPVKVLNDNQGNAIVLVNYRKTGGPGILYKIILNKYDLNGMLIWSHVFDNNGIEDARATDMALDAQNNIYVIGALMSLPNEEPYMIRVNSSGISPWQRIGTTSFSSDALEQIFIRNNNIYLAGNMGMALFYLNGTEQWSNTTTPIRMNIDKSGNAIVSTYSLPTNISKYDSLGNQLWGDSSILADRIVTDLSNNIYLFGQYPYQLVKLDSNGVAQWASNSFPVPPPFGDISFDILVDYNQDLYVIGVADTIFKYDMNGNMLWAKSMDGLDQYISSSKINFNNMLLIAGIQNGFAGYDARVSIFNSNGGISWTGIYSSNIVQEFPVSMSVDANGIYVLEDSISNSTLIKFDMPWNSSTLNISDFCVDSVWYDVQNPNLVNISVFNGGVVHSNYPSIQMISPGADTISNVGNFVDYFAHLANVHQVYTDTITVTGITDFSQYHFVYYDGFGTTSGEIYFCAPLAVQENELTGIILFPNPSTSNLTIANLLESEEYFIDLVDLQGRVIERNFVVKKKEVSVDLSNQSAGFYFIRLTTQKATRIIKIAKGN